MRVDAVPPVGSEDPSPRADALAARADAVSTRAAATTGGVPTGATAAPTTTPPSPTTTTPTASTTAARALAAAATVPPLPWTDTLATSATRSTPAPAPVAWSLTDRLLEDVGRLLARLSDLVVTSRTAPDAAARQAARTEASQLVDQIVVALRARALALPASSLDASATGPGPAGPAAPTGPTGPAGSAAPPVTSGGTSSLVPVLIEPGEGLRPAGVLRLPLAGVVVAVPLPAVDAGAPYGADRAGLDRLAAAFREDLAAAGLGGVVVVVDEARRNLRLVPALLGARAWPASGDAGGAGPGAVAMAAGLTGAGGAGRTTAAGVAAAAGMTEPAGVAGATASTGAPTGPVTAPASGAVRLALAENLRTLPEVGGTLAAAVARGDRGAVDAVVALVGSTRGAVATLGLAASSAAATDVAALDPLARTALVDDLAAAIIASGGAALSAQTALADPQALVLLLLAGMLGHPGVTAPRPGQPDPDGTTPQRDEDVQDDQDGDAESGDGDASDATPEDGAGGSHPPGADAEEALAAESAAEPDALSGDRSGESRGRPGDSHIRR